MVVSPNLRPQLRADLEEIFLRMHEEPDGKAALNSIGVDRFLLLDDSAYDTARQLHTLLTPSPVEP